MLPDPPHRFSVVVLCISRHVVGLHDVAIVEKSQNSNSCHPDPVLRTGMILNVININANGLRTKFRRDLLGQRLRNLQAGVGLITATHLRRPDLTWIIYPQ